MSTRFRSAAWAAILAIPLSAPASATELDLERALELATARSAAVRAAQAGASGAGEAALAAGQLPDPMLSVGIENLPVTGQERWRTTVESMTMKRIGISQEWLSSGKRALRRAAAQAQAGREAVLVQVAAADTRLQAALAYLDAHYAGEAWKLSRQAERQFAEEASAATARLAAGTAGGEEPLRVASARAAAEDESADAMQQQAAAQAALERWVGVRPQTLRAPVVPGHLPEAGYVAAHPAVLQVQRELEAARAEASATAADRHPNWTWQAAYGQRTGWSDMVSIGVSIPLPVAPGERQDRDTAAKLAAVAKTEAALEDAVRMAAAEHRTLLGDAQRLAQRVQRWREGVVAITGQRVQAALAGYRSNQTPLAVVFEARQAELDAQRKLLALQRDLAKVQAQLAFKPVAGGVQ